MSRCGITQDPIFFAMHHRCGNTYLTNVMNEFVTKTSGQKFSFRIVGQKDFRFDPDVSPFVNNTITRLRNFTLEMVRQLPAHAIVVTFKRDPRSLIASCTDYHLRGPEVWTLMPRQEYGGKAYYQYLRSAASDEDRLIISMENRAGAIIENMRTFINAPHILPVKLEDIARDESCQIYDDICTHMQLSDDDHKCLSEIFKMHSLWYIKSNTGSLTGHSTSGVSEHSVNRLQGRALERYQELFGDIHLQLGYPE